MKLLFPLLMSVLPGASVAQSQPSPQAPPDFEARRRCGTKREFTVAQGFVARVSARSA
jgi:hypothetical protein